MLCPKTMRECGTPSMCAPYNGCEASPRDKVARLEERVARLEKVIAHICPDKSHDI